MSSKLIIAAAAALAALASASVGASAQTLTRIETHAFYGATVTVEEGVRVFRPLPSTGHMIINPGGRTPVSLNISESVHHYVGPSGSAASGGGGSGGWVGGAGGGGLAWVPGNGRGGKHGHRGRMVGKPGGPAMKHIHVGGAGRAH